jgi:DNA-binding beta-propeller fold protein YncE
MRRGYQGLAQSRLGLPMKIFRALGVAFVLAPLASPQGLVFLGTWPKQLQVIDEAKRKVVDHIELATGVAHDLRISDDRKTIYAATVGHNGIEVIDVAARKNVNAFALDQGGRRVRFNSWTPDAPRGLIYLLVEVADKKIDRFDIGPPQFAVVDLAQKKIVRTADLPEEARSAFDGRDNMRISPDGKQLYLFQNNILIFDTTDFRLVDRIELAKLNVPGMASLNIGPAVDSLRDPGKLVNLFISTDPVVHRQVFGIARLDLSTRSFEFAPIGPANVNLLGLLVAPDRKTGYTVAFTGINGTRRSEFWVFDLITNRVIRRREFQAHTHYHFAISSTGKSLFIYGSGYEVEIYDAATLQPRGTIDVHADITTDMIVVPPAH